MGRRGSMKGRPGLLFILFICICLVVFYFSWQMLMSPKFDHKGRNSAIHEGDALPRSSGMSWKLRQQFEDIQHNKQPSYMVGENEIKMPIHSFEDLDAKKVSNVGQANLLVESFQNRETERKAEMKGKSDGSIILQQSQKAVIVNETHFFFEPIDSIQESVKIMERLVHLDFKGAVPNMNYLMEVIPLFEKLGATGLLVEYEDMFPFTGFLEPLKAANALTFEQLSEFLQTAKKHNLKVMPLIQTFGHMEFVLKSAFPELRESSYTPQVIDMTSNSSHKVILAMIQQVLDAHPDAEHLHIGCDEVYELGKGASATVMQEKKMTVDQMFLQHVKRVSGMVSSYKTREVVPVIWDDMLRKISAEDIASSSLPSNVDIMVWHYTPDVTEYVKEEHFVKYSKLFGSIWIASSFKGATGSRQFYTEPLYHIRNHFSWLRVIEQHHKTLKFKGVALTGWQRYDHFATLCELLPVAIPSLAVCLATMKNAGFTKEIYESTSQVLKCEDNIQMAFPEIDKKTKLAKITQDCSFPGSNVYYAMQGFYAYAHILVQHRVEGWLSDYQMSHGFSSPGQLKVLAMDLNKQNNGYTKSTGPLKLHLSSIFSSEDVEEWLEENIFERKRHNEELLGKVNGMLKIKTWPRRPLASIKVEKPNNPQLFKSDYSRSGSDQRLSKNSLLDTYQGEGRSKFIIDRSDTRGIEIDRLRPASNIHNPNDISRLSQSHGVQAHDHIGDVRSGLSGKDQRFVTEIEKNDPRADTRKSERIDNNISRQTSASEVSQKHNAIKDNFKYMENKNGLNYDLKIKSEFQNNYFDKSKIKIAGSQDHSHQDQKNSDSIKSNNLNDKFRLQEKLRNEHVPDSGSNIQNPHSHRVIGADISHEIPPNNQQKFGADISHNKIPLGKRQEFESIAKRGQSNVDKVNLSDFHDAKMEHYEENLIKTAKRYI